MFLLFYQKWRRAVQVDSSVKKKCRSFCSSTLSFHIVVGCVLLLTRAIDWFFTGWATMLSEVDKSNFCSRDAQS